LFVFLNSQGLVEPCCQWLRSPSQEYVLCLASVASWQRLLQMCRFRACLGRFSTCARKKKSWSGKYLDYPRYILFFLIHLFICAYIVWAILSPISPHFQAEPFLPFSLIVLKRRHKQ
jgi:hypothetical protein